MRDPKAKLHRPVEALRRVQHLAGLLQVAAGDRNPNRAAQLRSISEELFELARAALDGGPLPVARDHSKVS